MRRNDSDVWLDSDTIRELAHLFLRDAHKFKAMNGEAAIKKVARIMLQADRELISDDEASKGA
jgi:hypothetical protein